MKTMKVTRMILLCCLITVFAILTGCGDGGGGGNNGSNVTVPNAPGALTLTVASNQITAKWKPVTGATNYEVWYHTADTSSGAIQFNDSITTDTTCIITGLINGTTYYVWVKAKNSIGTSGFSPPSSATPILTSTINYFSWDCEQIHPSFSGYRANTQIVSIESHSGSHCMQITAIGDDDGNQSAGAIIRDEIVLGTVVDGKWYYYRWWMKFDSNFKWGNGTARMKASRVKQSGDTWPAPWTGYICKNEIDLAELEDGVGKEPWEPGGAAVNYNLQAAAGTGWHEYIVAMKMQSRVSASDAIFRVYVDGNLIGEDTGLYLTNKTVSCSEAWNGWMLSPYLQLNGTATDGGLMWLDDFSMDSDWNSLEYPKP